MLMPDMDTHVVDVVVVSLGDDALPYSLQVAKQLREQGIAVVHAGGGAAKRQFKLADREGARFVAVVGDDEMQQSLVAFKNLATGEQKTCTLEQAIDSLKC